jgi:adenylate cyclase class IV
LILSALPHINIEIKARTNKPDRIREILKTNNADFIGIDHQVDTYFKVASGRLKLRGGNIENHLIYYERENTRGPKKSSVMLYKNNPDSNLKEMLAKSLGVLAVVDKHR